MNISIDPIKVNIDTKYLYDGLDTNTFMNATIIGVSSYVGYPLTFHVLVDNKYLYSDIPISAFSHGVPGTEISDMSLKGCFCPAHEIENFTFEILKDSKISCYYPAEDKWIMGEYITSFDFYTDNISMHLVKLSNGRFGLVPNHKINFKGEFILADFKKSHIDHRV